MTDKRHFLDILFLNDSTVLGKKNFSLAQCSQWKSFF